MPQALPIMADLALAAERPIPGSDVKTLAPSVTAGSLPAAVCENDPDTPKEACGVFGVYAPGEDVARLTFYGLYALQHRGQESAGIATADGERLYLRTG